MRADRGEGVFCVFPHLWVPMPLPPPYIIKILHPPGTPGASNPRPESLRHDSDIPLAHWTLMHVVGRQLAPLAPLAPEDKNEKKFPQKQKDLDNQTFL